MSNLYGDDEEAEWITAIILVIFALMLLAVCLCAGLGEFNQRETPQQLRSHDWAEFHKSIKV